MLDAIGLTLGSLFLQLWGRSSSELASVPLVSWQEAQIFAVPTQSDPKVEEIVENYLKRLEAKGFSRDRQGIWIQSEWAYLGQNRENIPVSAASLTKVATTLAAIETWGTEHRFETEIYAGGKIENGVLQGDLIVRGSADPLFVWEEAIALGNALNDLGIRQVTGNLIIIDNFYMNFKSNPQVAGELLKQGLDSRRWSAIITKQYQQLPPQTPRPQVAIAGKVKVESALSTNARPLLRHQSMTLADIIKQMNIYSNNEMAEMLARSVGGTAIVARFAAKAAKVPPEEILLVNGSGLAVENRISPRAACSMFMALDRQLAPSGVKVSDLFPVAGRDKLGTMQWRSIPDGVTVKTGTLARVSALAGVIPTQERGFVWFAVINSGNNIEQLRNEQDRLLQDLARHWQVVPISTASVTKQAYLGDPSRNLKN